MDHRVRKRKKAKAVGMEAIVEPGVGALYVRSPWMRKLKEMGKKKQKILRKRI